MTLCTFCFCTIRPMFNPACRGWIADFETIPKLNWGWHMAIASHWQPGAGHRRVQRLDSDSGDREHTWALRSAAPTPSSPVSLPWRRTGGRATGRPRLAWLQKAVHRHSALFMQFFLGVYWCGRGKEGWAAYRHHTACLTFSTTAK